MAAVSAHLWLMFRDALLRGVFAVCSLGVFGVAVLGSPQGMDLRGPTSVCFLLADLGLLEDRFDGAGATRSR